MFSRLAVAVTFLTLVLSRQSTLAQAGEWTTFGHDPQRSGYAVDEHAFSKSNVNRLGLAWKTVVPNEPLYLTGLTAPLIVRSVKTATGPKNLVIVGGTSDHVFALNADTGDLVWQVDFPPNPTRPEGAGWLCPTGLNATPVVDARRNRLFVISSNGELHTLSLSDGKVLIPPAQFVAAYAKVWSLNYAGGILYASLSQDCNHVKSGVAALDPDQPGRPVVQFFTAVNGGAGVWGRGGVSVGYDGFIYAATGDAPFDPAANEFGDTVLKLSPRALNLTGYYTPDIWQYLTRRDLDMGTSTPVIFRWNNRVYSAVGGKEGALYITETAKMSDHHKTAIISPRYANAAQTFERNGIWGEISTWKDSRGDTWLYVPTWGQPTADAKFPLSHGEVKNGSIMAFLVKSKEGRPVLSPAWMSRDIAVPDPVAIAGDVVFVLGTGENTQQVNNGDINQLLGDRERRTTGHAILYALDAHTGDEIWSSGDAISGWTHFSGLAVGDGKILVTTRDGAIYAFALRDGGESLPHITIVPGSAHVTKTAETSPALAAPLPKCGQINATFMHRCSMCHGNDGKGQAGMRTPDFTDPQWQSLKEDKELLDAVLNGNDKGMPAFGGQLSSQEVDQLVHCMVRGFSATAIHQNR